MLADLITESSENLGCPLEQCHLVIDCQYIEPGREALYSRVLPGLIQETATAGHFASVHVAGGSFPSSLADVEPYSLSLLRREEEAIWSATKARMEVDFQVGFADYAVAHPDPVEVDPRQISMSPNIRYTTTDAWLIAKGKALPRKKSRSTVEPWSVQYPKLAKNVIEHQDAWCGADFSAGDKSINECAEGEWGPGNATNWRTIGTVHHVTFVAQQLSSLP